MSGLAVYAYGVTVLLLVTLAAYCFERSRRAEAKAEVYREFAAAFGDLSQSAWISDKQRKRLEKQRGWMRLCLCDPLVCEALRDALKDADEHWRRTAVVSGQEEQP